MPSRGLFGQLSLFLRLPLCQCCKWTIHYLRDIRDLLSIVHTRPETRIIYLCYCLLSCCLCINITTQINDFNYLISSGSTYLNTFPIVPDFVA